MRLLDERGGPRKAHSSHLEAVFEGRWHRVASVVPPSWSLRARARGCGGWGKGGRVTAGSSPSWFCRKRSWKAPSFPDEATRPVNAGAAESTIDPKDGPATWDGWTAGYELNSPADRAPCSPRAGVVHAEAVDLFDTETSAGRPSETDPGSNAPGKEREGVRLVSSRPSTWTSGRGVGVEFTAAASTLHATGVSSERTVVATAGYVRADEATMRDAPQRGACSNRDRALAHQSWTRSPSSPTRATSPRRRSSRR